MAALVKIVTTVSPVYILRKNPLPRIVEHCRMINLSFQNQCLYSSRRRWEDNTKIDLQELGCGSMDWIDLAQDGEIGGHLRTR